MTASYWLKVCKRIQVFRTARNHGQMLHGPRLRNRGGKCAGRQCFGPGKIGDGEMKNSLISRTCIMKPKDFLRSVILIVALSAFGISSGVASDKNEAKHSSKITKARAERIALTKVPGGSVRSAELETARGQRFWAVYIAKPGSNGKTRRSGRRDAEKPLRDSLAAKV